MPFQSKQQEKWAFATKQPFAKDWAAMTDQKSLPKRKKKNAKHKSYPKSVMESLRKGGK